MGRRMSVGDSFVSADVLSLPIPFPPLSFLLRHRPRATSTEPRTASSPRTRGTVLQRGSW